jgi:adenosylcobyric acid synthase
VFVGGTSSNAGKSWMATAICAWLRERGQTVVPFKAQNMSTNSSVCPGGGEIGRAQAAQAEACGVAPDPRMNPVLLKPNGDGTSQLIVRGRRRATVRPAEYYARIGDLWREVLSCYDELAASAGWIVIEGAGSVAELNLRDRDIANLRLVVERRIPWLLVADIERGGIFGSVIGTLSLLTESERELCRGVAVNRFRGDPALFDDGVRLLESRTRLPCLGVFPYAPEIALDAEDSLARPVPREPRRSEPRIAIIDYPCASNTTDFRLLRSAAWIQAVPPGAYDIVLLPGSTNPVFDLAWMSRRHLDDWVRWSARNGAQIIGICGGFQMLGEWIDDPLGLESGARRARGLGLLPARTELQGTKITERVRARLPSGLTVDAYEIHLGTTIVSAPLPPFAVRDDGRPDGVRAPGVWGTYLHGVLENPDACREICGSAADLGPDGGPYARLARWFETHARGVEWLEP